MPASNVAGYTKRTTSTAFVFLAYCVGNIIGTFFAFSKLRSTADTVDLGPHAFLAKEAPKYETGVKTILACAVAQVVLALCLRALLTWRNAQRDREEAENQSRDDLVEIAMENIDDITDFQNKKFRYAL